MPAALDLLQVLTAKAGPEGFEPAVVAKLRELRDPAKRLILLSFPPKCGGTYLNRFLESVAQLVNGGVGSNAQRTTFHPWGEQDYDLYLPTLLAHFALDKARVSVSHNHALASRANRMLMELFGLRPVVMVRPIADMLVSLLDAAKRAGRLSPFGSSHPPPDFLELTPESQREFLVRNVAPWYVKYYASWLLHRNEGTLKHLHFVTFEDFRERPQSVAREILEFNDMQVEEGVLDLVHATLESQRSSLRYNKGTSGRGRDFFTQEDQAHLHRLAAHYGSLDFVAEGLLDPLPATV